MELAVLVSIIAGVCMRFRFCVALLCIFLIKQPDAALFKLNTFFM